MRTLTLDDELPATARRLWLAGLEHGFEVWATAAEVQEGWRGKPCSSIAVRLHRGSTRLCGVWEDGSFRSGLRQSPFAKLNSRELVAAVTS